MADTKFIVTIRAKTDLDVNDVQGAVVAEAERYDVDHGNVDVELIELSSPREKGPNGNDYKMIFSVLDVA